MKSTLTFLTSLALVACHDRRPASEIELEELPDTSLDVSEVPVAAIEIGLLGEDRGFEPLAEGGLCPISVGPEAGAYVWLMLRTRAMPTTVTVGCSIETSEAEIFESFGPRDVEFQDQGDDGWRLSSYTYPFVLMLDTWIEAPRLFGLQATLRCAAETADVSVEQEKQVVLGEGSGW